MADHRDLLRFLTAGSVDDGKSTLIGRVLHDIHAISEDQLMAVRAASNGATGGMDFALVTDGLRAECEQGITIDVAYRYFATARRKFIVADAPGHEQYTRNMATGASTASLVVLLMDAHKGARLQTHRHAAIASLMGIRNFAVGVNKMDLVNFREDVFRRIEADFSGFFEKVGQPSFQFIPCCATCGDNVAYRAERMHWYDGPTLLEHLETVPVDQTATPERFRFPVQLVLRPGNGERHYAGQISSGSVRTGDSVLALPSGRPARVAGLRVAGEPTERVAAPASASIALDREIDLGRGDMLVDPASPPAVTRRFGATLLWMSAKSLAVGRPYLAKHTSRYVCASVARLARVIDPVTLERRTSDHLELNEFGEAEIETHQPLYADRYSESRSTGAFILVDPISNETLAAGMISADLEGRVDAVRNQQAAEGMAIWFTGLSSAGKSTISKAVYEKLWAKGYKVELLDGEAVRQHLTKDLGFSKQDRDENIRRIGFVAEVKVRHGIIVLVAAISPYRQLREEVRRRIGSFIEVYVNAPLDVVEQRDLKGIYRRCRAGVIRGVTGIDDPYEPPTTPEVECRTDRETLAESASKVIEAVEMRISSKL
jgi:bifunctional enzyme CysN/CysC